MDALIRKLFPSWTNTMLEKKLNQALDHKLYGLKPKHGQKHGQTFELKIHHHNRELQKLCVKCSKGIVTKGKCNTKVYIC